jgi:hypothetical protein
MRTPRRAPRRAARNAKNFEEESLRPMKYLHNPTTAKCSCRNPMPHRNRPRTTLSPYLLHVCTPLFLGGMTYVLFRETDLLMFDWFARLGLQSAIRYIRDTFSNQAVGVWPWLLYSLPDGLWVYSFCSFVGLVWHRYRSFSIPLQASVLLISLMHEAAQSSLFVPGTTDIQDTVAILTFGLISVAAISHLQFNQREL